MTLFATVDQNPVFKEKSLVRFFWSGECVPENALIVTNLPILDEESANYLTTDLKVTDTELSYTSEAWARFQNELENHEEF